MRYEIESNLLLVSVRELVSTARRGISSSLPCDADEPDASSEKCAFCREKFCRA